MEARGDEQHKPLTGDSLLFGDERHAEKCLSAGGGGGEGKRSRADDPAPLLLSVLRIGEAECKKRRADELAPLRADEPAPVLRAAPLLPLGEAEGAFRADPLLPLGEAKRRADELGPLLPLDEAEGKGRRKESAPGEVEGKKCRDEPAPLLLADDPGPLLRADHLLPLREADGSKGPAGGLTPLLSLGEAAGMKRLPPPKITIRTPELIAKAVQSNGAPPRRVLVETGSDDDDDPVALALRWRGVERDDYHDPHVHFFFYARPKEDAHNQMWRRSPLVLHDAALVAAMDSVIHWGPGMRGRYLDVSELVTRLLRNHPGPISTLRIDSSQFPGIEEFTQWLSLLSEKQAGHVSFVNLTAAVDIELPLHQLYSQCLTYLSLCEHTYLSS